MTPHWSILINTLKNKDKITLQRQPSDEIKSKLPHYIINDKVLCLPYMAYIDDAIVHSTINERYVFVNLKYIIIPVKSS